MKRNKAVVALIILFVLPFAPQASAQGPDDGSAAGWEPLESDVRITLYGPEYIDGEPMASGVAYRRDNDTVALGAYLLWRVRNHYYGQALELGYPMDWGWKPGFELWQVGNLAGCYHVPITLARGRLWGCRVRICAENAAGARYCREMRVMDTGGFDPDSGVELGVDLPDGPWLDWGYPVSQGVFTGTIEVLDLVRKG